MSLEQAWQAFSTGDNATARRLCDALLPSEQVDVLELHALLLASGGDPQAASEVFRQLMALEPQNNAHRINLGCTYLDQGQLEAAAQVFDDTCAAFPQAAEAWLNLGLVRYQQKHWLAAGEALAKSHGLNPLPVSAIYAAHAALMMGERAAAQQWLQALGKGFAIEDPETTNLLALVLLGLEQETQAERLLRQLLKAFPDFPSAKLNLALIRERANAVEEVQSLIANLQSDDPNLALLRARLLLREKQGQAALDVLAPVIPESSGKLRSELLFEQGKAADQAGAYDLAFASFTEANALVRDAWREFHPPQDPNLLPAWLQDHVECDPKAGAIRIKAEEEPVFVVGFPRSGTTLLDQMLDAHPALQVYEEKPLLDAVAAKLEQRPGGLRKALENFNAADAALLRKLYFDTAAQFAPRTGVLVDKNPLNIARLQLIQQVFPKAKIILALRHPCDVVLSCFMQNFRFTEATRGFWTLQDTAQLYDQILTLWQAQRQRLQPDVLEIRYENLIQDLEGHARQLCAFLGLDWQPKMLDYAAHAQTRRISTPSYAQVVQPIYQGAKDRWRNYQAQFAPIMAQLQPHIDALGYTVGDGA